MTTPVRCFQCERSDAEVPILLLLFQSAPLHICPQCLPTLIHHPERMADKLIEREESRKRTGEKTG